MTGNTAASPPSDITERRWEVALSFAGAQRPYVEQVAAVLKAAVASPSGGDRAAAMPNAALKIGGKVSA